MEYSRREKVNFQEIADQAHQVGLKALQACSPTPMVVQQHTNMLDDSSPVKKQWYVSDGVCGFAWINIKPATSQFVRFLKSVGIGSKDSYYGGWTIWVHEGNQSYEKKMAYARAYAKALQDAGINAYASGRLD